MGIGYAVHSVDELSAFHDVILRNVRGAIGGGTQIHEVTAMDYIEITDGDSGEIYLHILRERGRIKKLM